MSAVTKPQPTDKCKIPRQTLQGGTAQDAIVEILLLKCLIWLSKANILPVLSCTRTASQPQCGTVKPMIWYIATVDMTFVDRRTEGKPRNFFILEGHFSSISSISRNIVITFHNCISPLFFVSRN